MADNPYVNKVQLSDGTTLVDLTGDSVTAGAMLSGTTAHDASGAAITGTMFGIGSLWATFDGTATPAGVLGFGTWKLIRVSDFTWDMAKAFTWNEIAEDTWAWNIYGGTAYVWKRIA